jgi:hypothetical protein
MRITNQIRLTNQIRITNQLRITNANNKFYLIIFGNGNPSDLITSDFEGAVYSNTIKNI